MRLRLVGGRAAARTGVAWCAIGRLAGAQVSGIAVDPHILVLTPARQAGAITILNPRATRAEFGVDLSFGFATTDSAGRLKVELSEGPDSASAAGWITPYPRHFTLQPGAARIVRFLARQPATLPDGEYWARIIVHARDAAAPMQFDVANPGDGRISIAMETATVLPLFFRKGAVSTGVTITAAGAVAHDTVVDVGATLARRGSGAFIGIAHITIRDSTGRRIATADRQLAVYRTMRPRWQITIPPGAVTDGASVTISLATDRHDVPRDVLVQAPTTTATIPIYAAAGP